MFSLWTWKVQNCFKLQTPPPPPPNIFREHSFCWNFTRVSTTKKMTGCVSPILPYVTLRLIPHFSSLLCKDSGVQRGVLQNCPSRVLLTEQTHWHQLMYKSMQPHTYQCWYFLNYFWYFFYPETDRSRSILFPSRFIRSATDFALAWLQILFWPNASLDTPYSTSVIQTPSDLALMV